MRRILVALITLGLLVSPLVQASQSSTVKVDQSTSIKLPEPPKTQVAQQQDIVHITKAGHKYHRSGCRYLNRSDIPITREQAIRMGFTPCSVCNP
jgi:hypothetical protein